MPEPTNADKQQVRPFAAVLQELGRGKTHAELSDALHDLVGRVKDTGKKGTLVLKVTVAPLGNDGSAMKVVDEIKLQLPEHDRPGSIAFVDRAGNLTRTDPNQLELPMLRQVDDDRPANVDADGVIHG